jgi:capsid assembly protease
VRTVIATHRFLNRPLALRPTEMEKLAYFNADDDDTFVKREAVAHDRVEGVAIIPVAGILMHGSSWLFGTGYDDIRASFNRALVDPKVEAIVLHVDSPGGEVAGCFDLVEAVYAARDIKPIWAILDETAYSAAYALASASDFIVVPRTGGTGSIGVVAMHVDMTAALEQSGLKVTTVQSGARKAEQYPTTPLSDDARARMQADIDQLGEMFVELVARNRGLSPDAVRDTEAGTFLGAAGVDAGLADVIASPQESFMALLEELS